MPAGVMLAISATDSTVAQCATSVSVVRPYVLSIWSTACCERPMRLPCRLLIVTLRRYDALSGTRCRNLTGTIRSASVTTKIFRGARAREDGSGAMFRRRTLKNTTACARLRAPAAVKEVPPVRLGLNQSEFCARLAVTQSRRSRYGNGRRMSGPVRKLLGVVYLKEKP